MNVPGTPPRHGAAPPAGTVAATRVEQRAAVPYVAIAAIVPMAQEGEAIAWRLARLRSWLKSRGVEPAGAPFVRYRRIEMPKRLDIEVALPVPAPIPTDGEVIADALPAGRYAVRDHVGPPDGLVEANAALQRWAAQEGVSFDATQDGDASAWGARVETSLTDPDAASPGLQRTEIAYRLR